MQDDKQALDIKLPCWIGPLDNVSRYQAVSREGAQLDIGSR